MLRRLALTTALACALVGAGRAAAAPVVRYVDVSVATLWTSPSAPRAIDRPALTDPVDLAAWNRVLDTSARRGLVGRIETQALFGAPVRVLRQRGAWTQIAVPDQPTPRNRAGYPGWVPTRQLQASATFGRLLSGPVAVVVRPTAWLRGPKRRLEVSFGTRLPLRGFAGGEVVVVTPDGTRARLARSAVRTYRSPSAIAAPTGQGIVAAARAFLGVRYLWGGTSAFGLDCSGLINLIYRAGGIVIPRDADAQALAGRRIAWSALAPGDLLFYGRRHIGHVALYAGRGMMIEAPNSASSVRLTPARRTDLAGTRRYLR